MKMNREPKYIVIVSDLNGVYDCILNTELYFTRGEAEVAVEKARSEDKQNKNWQYEYEIATVYDQPE